MHDQTALKVNLELKLAKESLVGFTKEINALHKELLESKTKLETSEIEKFSLKQELSIVKADNLRLNEKIQTLEAENLEENEQNAIKNLSNIILSRERTEHRAKTTINDKDFESKFKNAEADRDQFKIRYFTTLETLKSTDDWILGIIDLINFGNHKTAIEEFIRTQRDFQEQFKQTSLELNNFNDPSTDRSYSSPISKTSLMSPGIAYDSEFKTLAFELAKERESKKNLEDILRDLQQRLDPGSDNLAYLQCQASVLEEFLQLNEEMPL